MTLQDLLSLPLSAYTPGQGDPKMEGGWETSTGAPVYSLEMFLRGQAPYVTGATRGKPTGAMVMRTIGDNLVPVRVTDRGPGVKGLDIATENKGWATNFPYQGSRDKPITMDPLARYGMMMNNSPAPAAPPPPITSAAAAAPGGRGQMSTWGDYAKALTAPSATETAGGIIGALFSSLGKGIAGGSQSQPSRLRQRGNPMLEWLKQLAAAPTYGFENYG